MIRVLVFWLALVTAMVAMPAHAQFALDSDAPIDSVQDTADFVNGVYVLEGQVDVRQADVRILADKMQIYPTSASADGALNDIARIVADGNFYYITPEQEVKGDRGVYLAETETFTVTGNVVLIQDGNVVTGDKLIYDLRTDEARVVGTCKGRRCGREGRVRILIRQQNASSQPT